MTGQKPLLAISGARVHRAGMHGPQEPRGLLLHGPLVRNKQRRTTVCWRSDCLWGLLSSGGVAVECRVCSRGFSLNPRGPRSYHLLCAPRPFPLPLCCASNFC